MRADSNHLRHIGYWLIFAWIILCALATLGMLISKSRLPRSKKILWLPFVPLLVAIVYAVMYGMRLPIIKIVAGDITVVLCLLTVGIFESCIQTGLIRSNTNYEGLFHASGIAVQIADNDYQVRYSSGADRSLSVETMRRAENGPVELDKNARLSSAPITGGHALWIEDISEMNRLLTELKEAGKILSGENDLLQAELELKERKAAVDEKNRLYDRVTREAAPQFRTLDGLLSDDTVSVPQKLVWLCILGAYVKRRSNLIILSEDSGNISTRELEYCLRQSAEAISECGFSCHFKKQGEGILPMSYVLLLYDLFEEIIELMLPGLSALLINLRHTKDTVELKLQACPAENISAASLNHLPRLKEYGGSLTEIRKEDTLHITVTLPAEEVRP